MFDLERMSYGFENNNQGSDHINEQLNEDLPDNDEVSGNVSESETSFRGRASQHRVFKKRIKKEERQIKKSEDKIINFLIEFIKEQKNNVLLIAVSKVLATNLSSIILVHALILTNPELLEKLNHEEESDDEFKCLENTVRQLLHSGESDISRINQAVTTFHNFSTVSPQLLLKLKLWMEGMIEATLLYPNRSFETFQKEIAGESFKYLLSVIIVQFLESSNVVIDYQKNIIFLTDKIFDEIMKNLASQINKDKYLN